MKRLFKTLVGLTLAAVMTLGLSTAAFAADATGITVNGTGKVMVDPDTVKIYAQIETTGDTAAEAQSENNKIAESVKNAMLEAGIKAEDMLTESTNVYPERVYDSDQDKSIVIGYTAYTSLSFATKDVDNAGKYFDKALEAGATGCSVSFYIEDTSVYYADALKAAVKSAENSAKAIADACGVKISGVKSVTESTSNYAVAESTSASYDAAMEKTEAEAGRAEPTVIGYDKITISARISITYGI